MKLLARYWNSDGEVPSNAYALVVAGLAIATMVAAMAIGGALTVELASTTAGVN